VAGIVVLAIAAISARSVALAGFALDSLIEIGASTVVIWELSGTGAERQRRGQRLIGYALAALAVYLLAQSTVVRPAGTTHIAQCWGSTAVLLGLVLNATLGWWWADPAAGYVLVCYAAREVREILG
jgi:divalent metal cation (Fe/Co/Zn/Cd) transporter